MNTLLRPLLLWLLLLLTAPSAVIAADHPGAEGGVIPVATLLKSFPTTDGESFTLAPGDTEKLLGVAADTGMNIFELLDCAYRYTTQRRIRLVLPGSALREAARGFDMGGDRIDALLPLEKIDRLEIGSILVSGQEAMDVYLLAKHEQFIEIGTAVMENRFGFKRLAPNLFDLAYGVRVQRFPFNTELIKLELYAPVKGAIYVKALLRPKRWNLNAIERR